MGTLDRVAQDIRGRAEQLRGELADRERAYRAETQQLRDELGRLDAALRVIGDESYGAQPAPARRVASRAPRGQNKAKILAVLGERPGVSAAEVAQATQIASATVSSTLAKMTAVGEVLKEQLPSGGVGYRMASDGPESI